MSPRSKAVAVVLCGAWPHREVEATIEAARRGGAAEVEVALREGEALGAPEPERLPAPDARAIGAAVTRTNADTVLLVSPLARATADLVAAYASALEGDPDAVVAYGDYWVRAVGCPPVHQPLIASPSDPSEWSTLGHVIALKRRTWELLGGLDPTYDVAAFYDLRLRLAELGSFARVSTPLYEVGRVRDGSPLDSVRELYRGSFAPESCERPGFAYMHFEPSLAAEIDRAFGAFVRRRGAALVRAEEPVRCPHTASDPVVSVVVPTFDRGRFLGRAIESVLGGTFREFELLVVDNGSTDGSLEMVRSFAARDPRVRLLQNRRGNHIAHALNAGVAAARGKYVSQLDSDDEYMPDTLRRQVEHLERNPGWGLAVSYYDVIDAEGRPLEQYGIIRHDEYDRNTLLRTGGAGSVRTWHRCLLERLGGFDEGELADYAEDYDMTLRLSERYEVGRVPHVLYRQRFHGGNTGDNLAIEFRMSCKAAARRRALERRVAMAAAVDEPVR